MAILNFSSSQTFSFVFISVALSLVSPRKCNDINTLEHSGRFCKFHLRFGVEIYSVFIKPTPFRISMLRLQVLF